MGSSWHKNDAVEVYDFEGEKWRPAIVLQPEFEIAGIVCVQIRFVDDEAFDLENYRPNVVLIAPELVSRHVRVAS